MQESKMLESKNKIKKNQDFIKEMYIKELDSIIESLNTYTKKRVKLEIKVKEITDFFNNELNEAVAMGYNESKKASLSQLRADLEVEYKDKIKEKYKLENDLILIRSKLYLLKFEYNAIIKKIDLFLDKGVF